MTSAELQALRDAIFAAIQAAVADGTWRVQTIVFDDQSTTLRSIDDARKWLKELDAEIAAASGGLTKYVTTSKGV